MSYFLVLAFFPFLLFLASLIGHLPFTELWPKVLTWISLYFPRASQRFILEIVLGLTTERNKFLSVGLLTSIWVASSGVVSYIESLNAVYEVKESRSFWKIRALAVGMLLILAFFFLTAYALMTAGEWVGLWLQGQSAAYMTPVRIWPILRWALAMVLLCLGAGVGYYILPSAKQSWRIVIPGSIFVAVSWLAATAGFNLYVSYLAGYDKTYGSLAAFIGFMVWVYLSSLIVIAGAEINSELSKACLATPIRQANDG